MAKPSAFVAGLGFPATVALTEAAARLAASGRRVIPLASGDPDLPTPPHIVEAAIQALRDFWLAQAALDMALIGKPNLSAASGPSMAAEAAGPGH